MASSPNSERRAHLIREMAEDFNRTRQSLRSNSDFEDLTGSHLSVEDESSQPYHEPSQPLPTLPTENKKSSRFTGRPSLDFVIDTSAIGRAFPDMTGSSSSVDDGSSISIEVGRGLRKGERNLSQDGGGGSRDITPIDGRYKVDLSKLPRRGHGNMGRGALQEFSNNIEHPMKSSPPPMKATAYGTSGSSRQSSSDHRRAPSHQATVKDVSDHTKSSDGRPSTQNITVRSTRFGNGQQKVAVALPKRFTSSKGLMQEANEPVTRAKAGHKMARASLDPPTITSANAPTMQSFLLPNMPNMSELVSGIYDDGTPVFSHEGRGRFPSSHKSPAVKHASVPSLPVPQEEEAIMLSLQLLQEKVAELERNKAEAQITMKELQERNRVLEDERKQRRRSQRYDSGVGSSAGSEAGDEGASETRKATIEKNRLESQVRNLQHELDGANRRAAVAEANAHNVAQERDAAISQLGVAFVSQEELKVNNEMLKAENRRLNLEVKKLRAVIEEYIRKADSDKTEASKSKVTEEESASQDARSIDCQVLDVDTPKRPSTRREMSRTDVVRDEDPVINVPKRRRRRVVVEEYTIHTDFDGFTDELRQASQHVSQNVSRNVSRNVSQRVRPASPVASIKYGEGEEKQQDITQASRVSFLQEGDVTMLRKMLEREHLEKKGRITSEQVQEPELARNQTSHRDITQLTNHTVKSQDRPRKPSMKDLTSKLSVGHEAEHQIDAEKDDISRGRVTPFHKRSRSEETVAKHQKPSIEDVTSAFILPDITMNLRQRRQSQPQADATMPVCISADALQAPAEHEPQNCTICTRMLGACSHTKPTNPVQEEFKIPIPTRASERIRDLGLEGEDHTTRPSEPPSQALARTIKALEDEFAHLGLQLAELQAQYNALDPSLQKRKRKALGERIEKVRRTMDAKGDQVYALYDVLEGQEKDGRDLTEKEIHETLTSVLGKGHDDVTGEEVEVGQNLGLPNGIMFKRGLKTSTADVTPAKERAKPRRMSNFGMVAEEDRENKRATSAASGIKKFPWDESYDDEDVSGSLPWEGFEDTINLTRGSRISNTSSRRRSIGL